MRKFKKMLQNSVVDLNRSIKIRFADGNELSIRIIEHPTFQHSSEFLVNKEAPLGKALLGHYEGEEIEYFVEGNNQKVVILEIQ